MFDSFSAIHNSHAKVCQIEIPTNILKKYFANPQAPEKSEES